MVFYRVFSKIQVEAAGSIFRVREISTGYGATFNLITGTEQEFFPVFAPVIFLFSSCFLAQLRHRDGSDSR